MTEEQFRDVIDYLQARLERYEYNHNRLALNDDCRNLVYEAGYRVQEFKKAIEVLKNWEQVTEVPEYIAIYPDTKFKP